MRISDKTIDRIYISSAQRSAQYCMRENHQHDYYELYYVRQGKCNMYIDSSLFALGEGDVMIIPQGVNHFTRYLSQCSRINLYFNGADIEDASFGEGLNGEIAAYLNQTAIMHIPVNYRDVIDRTLDAMLAEEKIDDESTSLIQRFALKQLILYIKRYGIRAESFSMQQNNKEIIAAVNYINENYSLPISLGDLAKMAGLSYTYFSKKFHAVVGIGINEYLNYIRLTHAANELKSTNHSITDVALNCGFNNGNHFKDSFKKMYGMSPRAYRNSRENGSVKELAELNGAHNPA
ncbi:MAG: AraC family transcriptional regulator [Clostridiales bacterium]|nr:AraC family transcriptional regulator [Clostridiales bacterium]